MNWPPRIEKLPRFRPLFVAIAGASGSGKSWLADQLQAAFGKEAERLALDWFYRDRSHLPELRRSRLNFDHPRAIDWEKFEEVLKAWVRGRAAAVPSYDFATHTRGGEAAGRSPKSLVLVEGLWLLRRPAIRGLFDLKVFLECSDTLCWERRLARDVAERGRSEASVQSQFHGTVLPMARRFVVPQARRADMILTSPVRPADLQTLIERIQALLRTRNS